MVAAGGRRVRAVLVVGEAANPVTPCGGCRQKLREFAADDCPIIVADSREVRGRYTLGQLLPVSFGPQHLRQGPSDIHSSEAPEPHAGVAPAPAPHATTTIHAGPEAPP
jgi:hypothetical protein